MLGTQPGPRVRHVANALHAQSMRLMLMPVISRHVTPSCHVTGDLPGSCDRIHVTVSLHRPTL